MLLQPALAKALEETENSVFDKQTYSNITTAKYISKLFGKGNIRLEKLDIKIANTSSKWTSCHQQEHMSSAC